MPFITIEGQNKIALQQGNELLLNVSHFVLANITGLGTEPVDRIETLPDPGDIVDTRTVSQSGYVNDNQVVYSLVLDSSIGDYSFNWIGIKDEDDVLIACAYIDTPIDKIATNGGTEGNNLIRNFLLAYSGIQATTAINAPASTWQIDFTTRLLEIDERERLSNLDIYGHEAFYDGAFAATLNAGTVFDIAAGVAFVGGVRCEFASTQQFDVGSLPNEIWLDASLQGDLTGKNAVVQLVNDSGTLTDYTDGNGYDHYVAKICDITGGAAITDQRVDTNFVPDHEARPDPHPQYLTEAEADSLYKDINAVDVPVGSLLMMDGDVLPAGYLKRNGAALSRTTYADLWAYAQTVSNFVAQATKDGDYENYAGYYGDGDGTTTFTLPDARGEFIRAWDDERGIDSGRSIGSFQADEFLEHRHALYDATEYGVNGGVGSGNRLAFYNSGGTGSVDLALEGGEETRPRNISYLFCVKY